jgi:hypothetical protein
MRDTIERYVPKHLSLWTLPDYYAGETFEDYYVVMSRHRDSDLLTESNWDVAEARLDAAILALPGQDDGIEPWFTVARASHWAVGWCETMLVHKDAPEALLRAADRIAGSIADYPVLDESDFCQREEDAAQSWWEQCGTAERVRLMKRIGRSIFAAKHKHYADAADDNGMLRELLLE